LTDFPTFGVCKRWREEIKILQAWIVSFGLGFDFGLQMGIKIIALLVNIVTNQGTQLNGAASNYSYRLNVPMANCASSTDG